jgi:transposase-like protein
VAFDDRLGAGDRPAAALLRVVAEHLERFVGVDRVARERSVHRSALEVGHATHRTEARAKPATDDVRRLDRTVRDTHSALADSAMSSTS